MGLKRFLKQEFGLTAMRARATRKDAANDIKHLLTHWADYGSPKDAQEIISIIKNNTSESTKVFDSSSGNARG